MTVHPSREKMFQGLELKSNPLRLSPSKTRKLPGGAALQADPGENLEEGRQFLGPMPLCTQNDTIGLQDES